jgi:Flp pilus assembly protein TadG
VSRLAGEGGAVTAEFAVALPAVMAVAALLLSGAGLQVQRLALFETAATMARAAARGESQAQLSALAGQAKPHAKFDLSYTADFVCVRLATAWAAERACERKGGL